MLNSSHFFAFDRFNSLVAEKSRIHLIAMLHKIPFKEILSQKLTEKLQPVFLDIINESYMHNVPSGSDTHYKIVIVSEMFTNMPLIKRHRYIYDLLDEELKTKIHALSIDAKTPEQWNKNSQNVIKSPTCLGGMIKDPHSSYKLNDK